MTEALEPREFDVAIAGGGLVGASLALALAPLAASSRMRMLKGPKI